jgi:hypothetical protein
MLKINVFLVSLALHSISGLSAGAQKPDQQIVMSGDVAPGILLIDLSESGSHTLYWQYEVQPATGRVQIVKEQNDKDRSRLDIPRTFLKPTGAIGACSEEPKVPRCEAVSGDGKFIVRRNTTSKGRDELVVIDATTSSTLFHWMPKDWRGLEGFGWAPNSHSIAILNDSEHYGKINPLELLSAGSGHPVPHNTVYLDIIDIRTGSVTEYLIQKNIRYAFGRILSWSK